MFIIPTLNIILCIYCAWRNIAKRRTIFIYWSMSLYLSAVPILFPSSITIFEFENDVVNPDTASRVAVFVFLFNILFHIGYEFIASRFDNSFPAPNEYDSPRGAIILRRLTSTYTSLFLCSVVLLTIFTVGSFSNILTYQWTDLAEMYEGHNQYGYLLSTSLFICSCGLVPVLLFRKNIFRASCTVVMIYAVSAIIGSRTFFLNGVLPFIVVLIYMRMERGSHRLFRVKYVLLFSLGIAVVYNAILFAAWIRP